MRRAPKDRQTARPQQALLQFPNQHGGRRAGAGRKPKGQQAGVGHDRRAAHSGREPVHVTVKLQQGLPKLRRRAEYAALRLAFAAGCTGVGRTGRFRLCHYAVLDDHLHLLVEAEDRTTLTRGLQGLLIRIAKILNKLWHRRGRVFADRYHDRILKSPREVRNCIRYVLANGRKHAAEGREVAVPQAIDTYTSAPWFDGFRERIHVRWLEAVIRPVAPARTWMLTQGWRRHGLISVHELPATA